MDRFSKKLELLKVHLEHSRAWAISFLALMITSFIASVVLQADNPDMSLLLSRITWFFILGSMGMWLISTIQYVQIRKHLGEEPNPLQVKVLNFIRKYWIWIFGIILLALLSIWLRPYFETIISYDPLHMKDLCFTHASDVRNC